jgi:hypothetical protein
MLLQLGELQLFCCFGSVLMGALFHGHKSDAHLSALTKLYSFPEYAEVMFLMWQEGVR